MKLAYKITLPLVALVTALTIFVSFKSESIQKDIIKQGQDIRAKSIQEQFDKNRSNVLDIESKNLNFIAKLAADISMNYLYNFNFEALEYTLKELLGTTSIKAIEVTEALNNKTVIKLGKKQENYQVIKQDVVWQESEEKLGEVIIYYDNSEIINYFNNSQVELSQKLKKSDKLQDEFLNSLQNKQTFMNLGITLFILIALFLLIFYFVIKPLVKVEKALNSFFMYLQGKTQKTEEILIKSGDEFEKIAKDINSNIKVSAKLHEEIKELNNNLEQKVEQRTQELQIKSKQIKQLLDNTKQGFLSFGKDLKIEEEYSKECENIFKQNIANKSINQLLFTDTNSQDAILFKKMINDILSNKTPKRRKKVLLNLFQTQFYINKKTIQVLYKLIDNEKIMLILSDITQKIELETKVELERKRLKMIVSVVSNLDEFHEMVEEFYKFCETQDKYLDEKHFLNHLTNYYRIIHTFKGNFAQKELIEIVPKLHEYETKLNTLVKDPKRDFNRFKTLIETTKLKEFIDDDLEILKDILGNRFLETKNQISISENHLIMIENKIKQLVNFDKNQRTVTYEEILKDVKNIKRKSLVEHLNSYKKLIEQLSEKLDKKIYELAVLGDDLYVTDEIKPFIKNLVHIFRNTVDHGIELPEERIELNKDKYGTINCIIDTNKKFLNLQIIDDGKGINIEDIEKKALDLNLYTKEQLDNLTYEQKLQIIFNDNFSTKDKITELSGRGVGLSAVKSELEKLNGTLKVETTLNKGTIFSFFIPLEKIL